MNNDLEIAYNEIMQQFFPETLHRIPIVKSMPVLKAKQGVPLTEVHKRHISEALKNKYGVESYNDVYKNFIEEHSGMINKIVNKYAGLVKDKQDLMQEALVRVYENLHRYKPELGAPTTWLNKVVGLHLHSYVLPETLRKRSAYVALLKLRRAAEDYKKKTGKEPTLEDLSKLSGIPLEKVINIKTIAGGMLSLNEPTKFKDDEGSLLGDFVADEKTSTPEQLYEHLELKEMIDSGLNKLDEREQHIIKEEFGMNDGVPKNDSQIAREMKITSTYVAKLRKKAFQQLRKFYESANYVSKSEDEMRVDDRMIQIYLKYLSDIERDLDKMNETENVKNMIKTLMKAIGPQSMTRPVNIYDTKKRLDRFKKLTEPYGEIPKSYDSIRIRQRDPQIFDRKTMRTIELSKSLSIRAVIGELPNDPKTRIQTLIFNRDPNFGKAWNLFEAKQWTKSHKDRIKVSINLRDLLQKCQQLITDKGVNQ